MKHSNEDEESNRIFSGKIEVFIGPMFSGKTERMIQRINSARASGEHVQIFYPKIDTRFRSHPNINSIQAHSNINLEATPISTPYEIFEILEDETSIVAIDEIQFFDRSLTQVCFSLSRRCKQIILAGLDRDFRGEPFDTVLDIITKVRVNRFRADCTICHNPADFTQRIINNKPASYQSPLIMIGGSELYEPRCQEHFFVPDSSILQGKGSEINNELHTVLPGIIDVTFKLLHWIDKIQSIAQIGINFIKENEVLDRQYDLERYQAFTGLASEMKAFLYDQQVQIDPELIENLYNHWVIQVKPGESEYITPKITVSGAIFNDLGELLLVRHHGSPYWDLPGGWCDIGYSAAENIVKEVVEEIGLDIIPLQLLGIYDSQRWGFLSQTQLYALVFHCKSIGGEIHKHPVEIAEASYFAENALPSLLPGVSLCIEHAYQFYKGKSRKVFFDLRS